VILEAPFHATDQWQSLPGTVVEVRLRNRLYRRGFIDAAMPDASALWLAAYASFSREFIDKARGYVVHTNLYPRTDH